MDPYYYLRELNPEEAESRGIKFVRRNGKEIYMLPTNKENVWCCVGFWPNDSSCLDVYDMETRIVEKTYSKFSELVANCPLHSFNGNFCKEEFIDSHPCCEWRDRGKLHRLDGPAVVGEWEWENEWFLQDEKTDEETVKETRAKAIGEDEMKLI